MSFILNIEAAVANTDDGFPDLPIHPPNLGNAQKTVELTDHKHPNWSVHLIILGISRLAHF